MSKILKMSDRIKIKVGEVEFVIAPLNQLQKIEISECTKVDKAGNEVFDLIRAQTLLVKYGLKDVKGVFDGDGEEYKLQFENDVLTDDCVSEVFTIKEKEKYITSHFQCLNDFPDKLVDPFTGKKYQGVALERVSKKPKDG